MLVPCKCPRRDQHAKSLHAPAQPPMTHAVRFLCTGPLVIALRYYVTVVSSDILDNKKTNLLLEDKCCLLKKNFGEIYIFVFISGKAHKTWDDLVSALIFFMPYNLAGTRGLQRPL